MKQTKPPRQFGLKDGARSARPERSRGARPELETLYVPFGPAGEVLPDGGFEQQAATREWLAHVEAGRIGGA